MTTPFIRHQQEALLYVHAEQPVCMAPGTTTHVMLVPMMSELQATVAACPRLCLLVQVYVHFRVAESPPATVTRDHTISNFTHGLLSYQINGKVFIHLEQDEKKSS